MSNDDKITFITKPEFKGVIPEPVPAHKELPDWYKNTPLEAEGNPNERERLQQSTVKACMPFLEAMKIGWIFKSPADVEVVIKEGGDKFRTRSKLPQKVMSSFSKRQVGEDMFPANGPLLKFNNFWRAKAPEGYSMLMMPPMNRPGVMQQPFVSWSGIISIDEYKGQLNSPVLWTDQTFEGVIPQGTPLSQVIFFKRDGIASNAEVRQETEEEALELRRQGNRKKAQQRYYRNEQWHPIPAARNLHPDDQPDVEIEYDEDAFEDDEEWDRDGDDDEGGWQKEDS